MDNSILESKIEIKKTVLAYFGLFDPQLSGGGMVIGGGGEIRTLGGLSPSLVFKTSAFNRSATLRGRHFTLPEYFGEC